MKTPALGLFKSSVYFARTLQRATSTEGREVKLFSLQLHHKFINF